MDRVNRRFVMLSFGAAMGAGALPALAAAPAPKIHVLHDPGCGCCKAWVKILREDGFEVTTEQSFGTALIREKMARGIPQNLASCHTGDIEGYVVEGHVPPSDIRRLLAERPDAIGLSVPDMPYGSPGMGPEDRREAYDVMLIAKDGSATVFSSYDAAR